MITFDEVFTYEHLYQAAIDCCNGVRWKQSTQMFELRISRWVAILHRELHEGNYKGKGFTEFDIQERGKTRHIQAVHISERCVQKCLCEYGLKPLLVPKLIYDNSANIKGKGVDFALRRLIQHLTSHYKKYGQRGGILLLDYKDFFASIVHTTLIDMLRNDIQDDRLFDLTCQFINAFEGDTGLGLGSEVSQILAVYYTNKIDHVVKEKLHIKRYGRYNDDAYLIHHDTHYLEYCLDVIKQLSIDLGLTLNAKSRIAPLNKPFKYLKKRIFLSETGMVVMRLDQKNISYRRRTIKRQARKGVDADQSYSSWRGYALKRMKSYKTVENMDKLYLELNPDSRLFAQDSLEDKHAV